jgi:hypothetical protein
MAGSMPENLRGHWPTFHLSGKGGPTPGNWSFIAELAEFDMKIVRNSIPHNVTSIRTYLPLRPCERPRQLALVSFGKVSKDHRAFGAEAVFA